MEDDIEMYDMQIGFCESCGKKTIHFVQEGPFGKFVNCQECGSAIKAKEQDNTVETDKTEQ